MCHNKTMTHVKRLIKQLLGFFPSRLPVGMSEFDTWVDSLTSTYKLATSDMTTIKWVLASTIVRLNPTVAYKSKFYFYLVIQAAAAKEIAGGVFVKIKEDQRAAIAAKSVDSEVKS